MTGRRALVVAAGAAAALAATPVRVAAQSRRVDLIDAIMRDDPGAVRTMLLRGDDLDATTPQGANAMMYAALHGELDTVRELLERKAEVNKTGWTPLHFAAANGHAEVVRLLLERHAYIDAESPNGTTPLMMAARNGHPTVARLLVDEGADPTPRNQAGLDAVEYARLGGDTALASWLAERADAFRRRHGSGGTGGASPAGPAPAGASGAPDPAR